MTLFTFTLNKDCTSVSNCMEKNKIHLKCLALDDQCRKDSTCSQLMNDPPKCATDCITPCMTSQTADFPQECMDTCMKSLGNTLISASWDCLVEGCYAVSAMEFLTEN